MEHRLRSRWQHKVELSTLLKIAVARKKKNEQASPLNDRTAVTALATEAIESLKNCDKAYLRKNDKMIVAKKTIKADALNEVF